SSEDQDAFIPQTIRAEAVSFPAAPIAQRNPPGTATGMRTMRATRAGGSSLRPSPSIRSTACLRSTSFLETRKSRALRDSAAEVSAPSRIVQLENDPEIPCAPF